VVDGSVEYLSVQSGSCPWLVGLQSTCGFVVVVLDRG